MNVWFSPSGSTASGTSSGFASGSPHQFDWAWLKLNVLSDTAPLTASDKTVVLNLLPGTHVNAELHDDFTANCANWRLTLQGATAAGGIPVSGEVVLQFPGHVLYGAADGGNGATGVIQFASKSLGVGKEFARVVVQNLTLDGNWDAQDYIGAHYPRGYKNQPLSVSARTGRIRNVIVRNYGSHGLAPWSAYDSASGVECFPLNVGTTDVGQEPEDGDPRPWVVEDCEVTGFRGVYAGYNTAILAQVRGNVFSTDPNIAQWYTPPVFAADTNRRMVLVRRCQVRGGPGGVGMIGLGTAGINGQSSQAWSRHLTFADNVLLNVGAGFNTDTGQIVDLDFTNHLFLDVKALGYLGVINQADGHFATNFNVSGNSLRICGRTADPSYRDFEFIPNNGRLSNPLRVLGGLLTNYASGLVIQGAAQKIRFADNWFTTRPQSGFYTPNPANIVEAKFRPLWKPGASEPYAYDPGSTFFPYVDPAVDVVLVNNSASTVSFDFTARVNLTDAGTYTSFTDTTAPGQTVLRSALSSLPNFSPTGMVERLVFIPTNRSITFSWLASTSTPANPVYRTLTTNQNTLYGAYEVALGTPVVVNATTINVPVRLALQPTPSSGLSGTVPQNNQTVWLQTGTGTPVSLLTGTDGLAWFPVTLTSGANSLFTFRA